MFPLHRTALKRGRFLAAVVVAVLGLSANPAAAQSTESCPQFGWGGYLDPGPQKFEVVDAYLTPAGREVREVHFGSLKGKYAKAFLFLEFDGECLMRAVSIGSYASTVMFSDVGTNDPRPYHADLYEPGTHATLGFYEGKPSLKEMRALAMSVFSDKN